MTIHPDTARLDKLQRLVWSSAAEAGDVIALWPCRQNGRAFVDIQPLIDGDDGVLRVATDSALASGCDLRSAIDNLDEAQP